MKKISSLFPAAILSAGIAFAGYFVGDSIVVAKSPSRSVSVKGLSERIVKSDEAIWQMRFNYSNNDLSEIYKGVASSQEKIRQFLRAQGFKAENIQMVPVSVNDNASEAYGNNQKANRYSASSGVVLDSDEVDKVRMAVQRTGELVGAGVVLNSSYVQYKFNGLNKIKPTMLIEATANAKEAAEVFAKNSNSALGQIRYASQGVFTIDSANPGLGDQDTNKKVRVVTSVEYSLKQ